MNELRDLMPVTQSDALPYRMRVGGPPLRQETWLVHLLDGDRVVAAGVDLDVTIADPARGGNVKVGERNMVDPGRLGEWKATAQIAVMPTFDVLTARLIRRYTFTLDGSRMDAPDGSGRTCKLVAVDARTIPTSVTTFKGIGEPAGGWMV